MRTICLTLHFRDFFKIQISFKTTQSNIQHKVNRFICKVIETVLSLFRIIFSYAQNHFNITNHLKFYCCTENVIAKSFLFF